MTSMNPGEAAPSYDAKRVGQPMAKEDWREAVKLLSAATSDHKGRVFLPKEGGEYNGPLLLITDTHLVQRVGRGTAVGHDLNRVDSGTQMAADFEAGALKLGQGMRIHYGAEHENAQITLVSFQERRADEMRKDLTEWARTHITNSRGRETFLKHLDAATLAISERPRSKLGLSVEAPTKNPVPSKER